MNFHSQKKKAYSELENDLRNAILSHKLTSGQAICSEAELASKYKIGRNSVRTALNNLVRDKLIHKIKGSGTYVNLLEHNQLPSLPVSTTADSTLRYILFLSFSSALSEEEMKKSANFDTMFLGLTKIFSPLGYNLIFAQIGNDWTPPQMLLSPNICGIILHGQVNYDFWHKYIRHIPHVNIEHISYDINSNNVLSDKFAMGFMAVQHLYNLGHRRIGFVSNEIEWPWASDIYAGYAKAMAFYQLAMDSRHQVTWQRETFDGCLLTESEIPDYWPRLERAFSGGLPPTALICTDDWRALCTQTALEGHGFKIPDDISLTGAFGKEQLYGEYTSFFTSTEEIYLQGAKVLLEQMNDPKAEKKTIYIRPQLVQGKTAKKIR